MKSFGFYIDKNNNITFTPTIDTITASVNYANTSASRIGNSDSIILKSIGSLYNLNNKALIVYYNKSNNTLSVTSELTLSETLLNMPYKESSVLLLKKDSDDVSSFYEAKFK